jgi:4-hydroxy-tetrahydrodipicolinate synthase
VLERFPGFDVFSGSERFLLANLRRGGVGTISAMANVIPAKIRFLYDNYLAENADQLQEQLDRYRAATRDYAAIAALKQIMAERSGDPSWLNLRPPLVPLSAEAAQELLARYAAA